MPIKAVSSLGCSEQATVNIFLYRYFGEHVFLFLLNKYLGVELCFIKKRQLLDVFSKVVVPFYTSQQRMRVPVDLQSYTGLVLSSILILFISNEWFIVFMVLIFIPLMINVT